MKSGAAIKDKTYVQGFEINYYQVCPFCFATNRTDDHHCPGSDRIVDHLRNRLDDSRATAGLPPNAWCTHDNVIKRRKKYEDSKNS